MKVLVLGGDGFWAGPWVNQHQGHDADRGQPQPPQDRHRPGGGVTDPDHQHRRAAEGLGGDRRQAHALPAHGHRPRISAAAGPAARRKA